MSEPAPQLALDEAVRLRGRLAAQGRSVVLMKGVFDLLHAGHVRALWAGSALGNQLFVAVATDDLVGRKKGPSRPIIPFEDRAFQISSLAMVGCTFPNSFDDVSELLVRLSPDVFTASHFSGIAQNEFPKTTFVATPKVGNLDTSRIIARIRSERDV